MTAPQMIELLRAVRRTDPLVNFRLLADNLFSARLKDGRRLIGILDFAAWLRELGEEAARTEVSISAERSTGLKVTAGKNGGEIPPQKRWEQTWKTCPGCGHVHIGVSVCGMDMGGAGSCRCEMEVRV